MKKFLLTLVVLGSACAVVKPIRLAYQPSKGTRSFFGTEVVETVRSTGLAVLKTDYRQRLRGTFQMKLVDSKSKAWRLETNALKFDRDDLAAPVNADIGQDLRQMRLEGEVRSYGRTRGTFMVREAGATEAHHSARWAMRSALISAIPRLPDSDVRRDDLWRSEVDVMGNQLSAVGRVVKVRGDVWFVELKTSGKVRWEVAPAVWMHGIYEEVTSFQWSGVRGEVIANDIHTVVDLKDDGGGQYQLKRRIKTQALTPDQARLFLDAT
ncbi:MAG TPA: hypothetical protein DEB46_13635 [Myxococcales bacterium]|nr:hypothetical protein [Myxococcales bacterium]HBU49343.1 hypothetical protein [Myxococcales bacterium]|tara:strand:- start:315 stop:1115 length:801 start_codon:yes stop_codon:yes gene_type:complete